MTTGHSDTATTFGFRDVREEERQGLVNRVFASVAERYDLMNDLMSGGLHRLWKDDFVSMINAPRDGKPFRLIDVAGGTGDVAMRFVRSAGGGTLSGGSGALGAGSGALSGGSGAAATICDISPEMLAVGRRRIADAGLESRIDCVEGNAEALPFPDKAFDAYTIAFGIRNVTHIEKALSEAMRVLKIGGRLLVLEFSHVEVPMLDRLYDFHSFEVIPRLGKLAAGDAESYRYLVESIRKFPKQDVFAGMIRDAGFERVSFRNLTGGVAAIHSGWKI